MENLFLGGGWLDDLLREAARTRAYGKDIRRAIEIAGKMEQETREKEWQEIDEIIEEGKIGEAYEMAMSSVNAMIAVLDESIGAKHALERPLCPFMMKEAEIKKLLNPGDGKDILAHPGDDLEKLISLEMINSARRLLASWGTGILGEGSRDLIARIEDDLEELRECHAFFMGEGDERLAGSEREVELADRLATLATRFARELFDLHIMNAGKPEVQSRFMLLWRTVRQLQDKDSKGTAAFEAMQVFEEALALTGLASGELLQRVDLLYDRFSDAEKLRRVVNNLVNAYQSGEELPDTYQAGADIAVIQSGLADLGLKVE